MVSIRGVEVTQAIQYYHSEQHLSDPAVRRGDNWMTLVANKPAWVRVYVESHDGTDVADVSGDLVVQYATDNINSGKADLPVVPQPPAKITALAAPNYAMVRSSLGATLNFIIPSSRMYGPLDLLVSVRIGDGATVSKKTIHISPTLRQTLRLRGIFVGYNGLDTSPQPKNITIAAPTVADLQTTAGWALRVMPVRSEAVFQAGGTITLTTPLTGTATNGGCTAAWNNLIAEVQNAKIADGNLAGFIYYGLLPISLPNSSNNGGCGGAVASSFVGDQIDLAHEVTHACGRPLHPPCGPVGTSVDPNYPAYEPYDTPSNRVASIGEFGLDISTGAIPTPNTARDYLSYCSPKWTSLYTYSNLLYNDALNPEEVGIVHPWWQDQVQYDPLWRLHWNPGDPPPYWVNQRDIGDPPLDKMRVIAITGIRERDGRIAVTYVARTEVFSTRLRGVETEDVVALLDERGAKISTTRLHVQPSHGGCRCGCQDGEPTSDALITAYLPDVAPGAALVVIRGDKIVWERRAPSRPVNVGAPKVRMSGGRVLVNWRAEWPHAGGGYVWVRVSADKGRIWRSVALQQTGDKAVIDPSTMPAGNVWIQVVAHDGFHSAHSKPTPFKNKETPPTLAILHPHPKVRLVAGEVLHLWGSVAHQPGREDEDYRFSWTIDGKAAGDEIEMFTKAPTAGRHKLRLVARGRNGKQVARAEIMFECIRKAGGHGNRK
jgi:hypothetical protein